MFQNKFHSHDFSLMIIVTIGQMWWEIHKNGRMNFESYGHFICYFCFCPHCFLLVLFVLEARCVEAQSAVELPLKQQPYRGVVFVGLIASRRADSRELNCSSVRFNFCIGAILAEVESESTTKQGWSGKREILWAHPVFQKKPKTKWRVRDPWIEGR